MPILSAFPLFSVFLPKLIKMAAFTRSPRARSVSAEAWHQLRLANLSHTCRRKCSSLCTNASPTYSGTYLINNSQGKGSCCTSTLVVAQVIKQSTESEQLTALYIIYYIPITQVIIATVT